MVFIAYWHLIKMNIIIYSRKIFHYKRTEIKILIALLSFSGEISITRIKIDFIASQ